MSQSEPTQVFCVLGSNVGRRAQMMRRAILLLCEHPQITVCRASSVYETLPWGREDLAPYCNAVCELQTILSPLDLLDAFQAIEQKLGRPKQHGLWEPRVIDLDIALYGREIVSDPRLIVPHRFLNQRAFAMVPLLDLEPDLTEPQSGKSYKEYLANLGEDAQNIATKREDLIATIDQAATVVQNDRQVLIHSESPEQTELLGSTFSKLLQGGDLVALKGDLGAGKTCFSRGIARGLGVQENIMSPSYVLVRSYEGRDFTLHHADFYRINPPEENQQQDAEFHDLASLGLEDYLEDPSAIILVEWADNFPQWMQAPFWLVEVCGCGDQPRLIHIRNVSA